MPRFDFLETSLVAYLSGCDPSQAEIAARFLELVRSDCACLERSDLPGHLTGSALVVTPDLGKVLLTLHGKLGKWLQLGGHADGDPLLHRVAKREAHEESGLEVLRFLSHDQQAPAIFDLDLHSIPARGTSEPEHWHYDVRYVLVAAQPENFTLTEESLDLRWFSLDEAYAVTTEPSMHRQFDKLRAIA